MRIIADVETQLQRIRSAQKTHDDALAVLSQRSSALQQAEEDLARSRQDFQRERDKLDAQRSELESKHEHLQSLAAHQQEQAAREQKSIESERTTAAARAQELQAAQQQFESQRGTWEQQRRQSEESLRSREAELSRTQSQIQSREEELQRERQRIAQMEAESRKLQEDLRRQSSEFETRSRELQKRVEQAERNVGELISKLETTNAQLAERTAIQEKAAAEQKTMQRRIRELEQLLHEATQRADGAERDTAELARLADQQRTEVEQKLAEAMSELRLATQGREAALAETSAVQEKLAAMQDQLDVQEARLADSQQKFEVAGKKLGEFAAVLAEQTPQVERGASALVMVEQQHQQLERLTKELAEYKLRVDPAEMQRRDQRIHELTEALRQARGQSAGGAGVGEVEQRNAALTAQVNQLKVEVEKLTLANGDAQKQLKQHADCASSDQVHEALIAQHNARVAALTAEIEHLQSSAATDLQSQLEEQSRRHEQRLAESHRADTAEVEAMRIRIDHLEQELSTARSSASTKTKGDPANQGRKLKEKAEKITAVADHLRRRRARLDKVRQLLVQKQVHGDVEQRESTAEDSKAILEQKQQISDARRALSEAEREMVRRWARPRAAATMGWVAVLAGICAGASWLVAGQMSPAIIAASAVLEARNSSRSALTEEEAGHWKTWHQDLFSDAIFMQTLCKRLAERRMDTYATPQKIAQRLGDDLTIDASQKGALILTLAGEDEDETAALLDVTAAAVAAESFRAHGSRNDSAWATLSGERNEGGRLRWSTINPTPIKDERLKAAGPIFGVTFVVCLGLIAVVYTRLTKSKRVFDQENGGLFAEARVSAA